MIKMKSLYHSKSKFWQQASIFLTLVFCCILVGVATSHAATVTMPTNTGLPTGNIKTILTNVLSWLLSVVGLIAVISFAVSGIQYMTSAGSDDRMQIAKRNMLFSIIGIIVALSGFIMVNAINAILNGASSF